MSLKTSQFLNIILLSLLGIILFASGVSLDSDASNNPENSTPDELPQRIRAVDLDRTFSFAGEFMPRTMDALERLDRELTVNSYWHSSTLINLKRAHRYFPTIEKILREEGVPTDFKYLAVAESGLQNISSPAGAKGFWQLMPAVAKSYDLTMNSTREERYHIEKSTRAACAHIKRYKERFGSWTKAAAAYNIGETRFDKEQTSQKEISYYDMNFGEETNRYIFRILAMKSIFEEPSKYGFVLSEEEMYNPIDTYEIEVDKSIPSLGDFAHRYGTSYRQLKLVNPWLISDHLHVSPGEKLIIRIPKES